MTSYGTIPPPSLPPPPPNFTSAAKRRALSALATRRPWLELAYAFSFPWSLDEAHLRIRTNAAHFAFNYAVIILLLDSLILRRSPISLIALVLSLAVWLLYFLCDRPVVFRGRTLDDSSVLTGLFIFTVLVWFIADAAADIAASTVIGVVVVMLHAVLRDTEDIAVDEEAAGSGRRRRSWRRHLPLPAL